MIASKPDTPNIPRLEIVNVPPWNSSGRRVPAFALVARSVICAEMSVIDRVSARLTIGVIKPWPVETATAMSACANWVISCRPGSYCALTPGTATRALAAAATRRSLTVTRASSRLSLISVRNSSNRPMSACAVTRKCGESR
ncbi:MAG: hypothetical protein V9G19_19625 [Tetrasphaera sp.]